MTKRTVEDYLALPYHIEVIFDASGEEPGWFAQVAELPGCMTQANSFEAAGTEIREAMRGWIELALEDGRPIPEPRAAGDYSGKFVARVPRSLHRQLAEAAEQEGVSLNAFVNVALAKAVGQPAHPPGTERPTPRRARPLSSRGAQPNSPKGLR
jgi:antitoxin HicB